jgi:FkbM family methyltransferase
MGFRLLSGIVSRLPASWIRWIGSLRQRIPFLGPVIQWLARDVLATEGVIRHGIGAGLRFDARHGSFGYLTGTTEPDEQAALFRYLKPGGVFYDLGANIGFFTTVAGRLVGPTGRVFAFEPNPECAAQARRNADLNGFSHIEVVESAVSAQPGRTRLHLGNTNLSSTIVGAQSDEGLEVAVNSIDDFIRTQSAPAPTLVMIDVEGAEIDVLRGMRETIVRDRPIIMCEVHWINDEFFAYCRQNLLPIDYEVLPLGTEEFPLEPSRFHAVLKPRSREAQLSTTPAVSEAS